MIYKTIEKTKNNSLTPLFFSGKSFHSKYNPEREAEQLAQTLKPSDFFLVTGLGAAFHINALKKRFPSAFILILESSEYDIDFLFKNFPSLNSIFDEKTEICTIQTLCEKLKQTFIPAKYESFSIFTINSWLNENDKESIFTKIKNSLKEISADFSVQSHFGKLWQKNILLNLKLAKNQKVYNFPIEKKCIICAAGPSLDKKIDFLKKNNNEFYIISTDTALKTLEANKICADAVLSIDGQMVSFSHFSNKVNSKTLYIFDLMANASAVKKIKKNNGKILFTVSSHPLEQFFSFFSPDSFFALDSSSGTVTIAALDFAKKAGFCDISIIGADFGFLNNKTYAKGTYLDRIYYCNANKLESAEKQFSKLMFRTELINIQNKKTTEILKFYEENLYTWCKKNNCKISYENESYEIKNNEKTLKTIQNNTFDFKKFYKFINNLNDSEKKMLETAILPYIAWEKNQNKKRNSFTECSNIALKDILRYNLDYET